MGQKRRMQPGDVINRTYEVIRFLGSGYSGEVSEVRHLHVGAHFALKLMHPEDRDDAHKASRYGAEASTLFHLDHENIVRVFDANQTPDGLLFIVMELLHGETLTQRQAAGRLHPLRALKYAYHLGCGLSAAHEVGVVHRDVKPDNVFITLDDIAKLIDFTAARFSLAQLRTTEPRNQVGTLAFMSPDHLSGKRADPRMDQYSLGHLLYGMLRGRHAFEHLFGNQQALISAQYNVAPEPLARVAGLPAWLDEILAPALDKALHRRYPTMPDFTQRIWAGGRRLAKEIQEGRIIVDVPLGEPPIDFDARPGERGSRSTYVPPKPPARQTTGPVMPSRRVTLAPGAGAERTEPAGDDPAFDVAVTAPLPKAAAKAAVSASVPPSTTAAETERMRRPTRSRIWVVRLAFVLAVPAVGGLVWRERAWLGRVEVSVPAAAPSASAPAEPAPSASAPAEPAPSASVTAEPAPPTAPPAEPATATPASASAPLPAPPRAAPAAAKKPAPEPISPRLPEEGWMNVPRDPPPAARPPARAAAPAKPAPSAATAAPATAEAVTAPPPPPAPTAAPHRVFGTED